MVYKNNYDSKKNFHRDIQVKCSGYKNNFNAKKTFYDCIDSCDSCDENFIDNVVINNVVINSEIIDDDNLPPWLGFPPPI